MKSNLKIQSHETAQRSATVAWPTRKTTDLLDESSRSLRSFPFAFASFFVAICLRCSP